MICTRRVTNSASGLCPCGDDFDLSPDGRSRCLHFRDKGLGNRGVVGIDEHAKARCGRQQLVEQPKPLCPDVHAEVIDPGGVAARLIEAGNQTDLHGVGASDEDNGNRRCRQLGRESRGGAARCHDDSNTPAN